MGALGQASKKGVLAARIVLGGFCAGWWYEGVKNRENTH